MRWGTWFGDVGVCCWKAVEGLEGGVWGKEAVVEECYHMQTKDSFTCCQTYHNQPKSLAHMYQSYHHLHHRHITQPSPPPPSLISPSPSPIHPTTQAPPPRSPPLQTLPHSNSWTRGMTRGLKRAWDDEESKDEERRLGTKMSAR